MALLQFLLAAVLLFLLNRLRTGMLHGRIKLEIGVIQRSEQPELYRYLLALLVVLVVLLSLILSATFVGAEDGAVLPILLAVGLFSIAALASLAVLMGITSGIIPWKWDLIYRRREPIWFWPVFGFYLACALGFGALGVRVLYKVMT